MSHFLIKREMPGASDILKNKLNEIGRVQKAFLKKYEMKAKILGILKAL
jgi:hypothetical protein